MAVDRDGHARRATRGGVDASPANGEERTIDGKPCIYYDGYWIRRYTPPADTLAAKKRLIENLSRRLFHHTEPGINTPGRKLDMARAAYLSESDPARKRVAGAMLAGALFNRATDIFTTVVELQEKGVEISPRNELVRQCGQYFQEALQLGKTVKHYSGHEGIDELWGEPFKAFTMPITAFYESRYIKISQTMRDIDRIADTLSNALRTETGFAEAVPLVRAFASSARQVSETMRSDPSIFEVWPAFVAASEALLDFRPALGADATNASHDRANEALRLVRDGRDLLTFLGGARVPMPKSTREFIERCERFERRRVRTWA